MIAEISIGDDELDFTEGTFTVDSSYVTGKSSDSQQPAGTYSMRENDSLTQVAAQDLSGADAVLAAFESFCIEELSMPKDEEAKHIMKIDDIAKSPSLSDDKTKDALKVNNSIQLCIVNNDEGNTVMKVDDTSETNGPAMTSSSPCRQSSFKNKLEQASQNKRPVRNCRKKASKKVLLDLSTLQIIRRQRSSLCKRARSNVWGLLGNIASLSEHNGGLDIVADNTKRSRRPRGVQDNGKRRKKMTVRSSEKLKLDKNMTVRSSEQSKQKRHTPTGLITLKVKFGKETAGTMGTIPAIENKENDCGVKNPLHGLPNGAQGLLEDEVPQSVQFQSTCGNSENASGVHLPFKNTSGNLDRNTSDDLCDSPFYGKVAKVGATNSRVLDSGTSPDSEVINILPGSQISRKDSEELHHVLISSNGFAVSGNVSGLSLPWKGSEQERRKDELHKTDDCCLKAELRGPGILNKVQEFAKLGQRENMGDGSYSSNTSTSASTGNASVHTSNMEVFSGEPLPSAWVEFGNCYGTSKVENGTEANLSPGLDEQRESMESLLSQKLLPCSKGQKLNKSSRARKVTKSKSETPNLSRSEKHSKKKGNEDESKSKNEEMGVSDQTLQDAENLPEFRNHTLLVIGEAGETGKEDISLKPDVFINNIVADEVAEEWIPPRNAWVSCDDCHKWRRIPAALADKIEETNCRWVCKDNKDRKFADCSIPQEKSNAEINAELEISDASCEEDACDVRLTSNEPRRNQSRVSKQSPWTLIKSNLFLHRRRKTQTIDEIMVCGCKQPLDGRMGCGSKCLNSMLNIECIPGTCPCGESCSNQQFQKRRYAKLKSFECGKKGYGLQLLEDVSEGQFLIEYVGEVLDMQSYEARQREYAIKGHKHFYFMTLNGSEVIDACDKGNLGRFINHSCDPNCRTEKWMVNGEVCIGIFALRDIKKSEEVTFDYNYVRVFGAAAKKCVCGSSQCRGYIGGDPLNSDAIVQGDSDEEYPELVVACEDDEMDQNTNNLASMTSYHNDKEVRISKESSKHMSKISVTLCNDRQAETSLEKQRKEIVFRDKVGIDSSTNAVGCFEIMKESRQSMNASASIPLKIKMSLENECSVGQHSPSLQSGDVTSRDLFAAPEECSAAEESMENSLCLNQGSNTISPNTESEKLSTDREDTKRALKPSAGENEVVLSKFHPRTKISGKFSDKKRKPKADALNVKKQLEIENNSHVPPKHKRLLEYPSNGRFEAGRFEAVQEKLNELLDSDGGISKRKDASRGYLKLLLLTAASGDSGDGEAIQSNRDLSMILDALLKTKSRTVLVDIINKNGLQMLHNIMKRYRKEFIKIPILRKLLKVLEYLATREILNSEHINGGPRCHGVESFRDSILTLTEHMDKQVHQIARNFRDRWIPRCFRKYGSMDRDDCRMEFYRGPNHDRFSALHNNSSDQWAKTSETLDCGTTSVAASSTIDTGKPEGSSASRNIRKRKSRWDQPYKGRPGLVAETDMAGDGANNMDEDVPPGFSSPRTCPMPLSDTSSSAIDHKKKGSSHRKSPSQVAMGLSQKRFISRSSVAYGVPISIVQQFGTYLSETSESWIVAPGMPFQPFPPLPQYPREQSKCTSSQVAKRAEQNFHNHATPDLSQNPPTPSAVSAPDLESPGAINQFDFQRVRSHNNLGRKYFRQQKWNNSKLAPPWVRMRNGWGLSGTNSRNGMCPPGFGSGLNESRNSYNSQDISPGMQNGNFFHHHPQPQNWN